MKNKEMINKAKAIVNKDKMYACIALALVEGKAVDTSILASQFDAIFRPTQYGV